MSALGAANPSFAEATRRFLLDMPIARTLGVDVARIEPGRAELVQPYRAGLAFRPGVLQAAAVGALADLAAGAACFSLLPAGWTSSTADYTLKLLAPASGERLVGRGRALRHGRTLSVASADVYVVRSGDEELCATALVTMRHFPPATPGGHRGAGGATRP